MQCGSLEKKNGTEKGNPGTRMKCLLQDTVLGSSLSSPESLEQGSRTERQGRYASAVISERLQAVVVQGPRVRGRAGKVSRNAEQKGVLKTPGS